MRWLAAVAVLALAGCGSHRVVVTDQVSGQAISGITVTAGTMVARGNTEVAFDLPADDRTPVIISADGYQPWSSTAGVLRRQSVIPVILDPRWRLDFQRTPTSSVTERKPCPCKQRRTR